MCIRDRYEYASIDSSDTGTLVTANSYENFDYSDIPTVDGLRQSDIIDIRPKVKSYAVSEGVRSPFEFLGRSFNSTQNDNLNVLASDESIELDYSIYLGRIDRLFLTKQKTFQVVQGTPEEIPEAPVPVDNAMEIAVVTLSLIHI